MNARHRTIHDDSSEANSLNPFEVCGVERILHGLDHKSKSLNFSGRYGFKQMLDNLVGTQALGFGKETWQARWRRAGLAMALASSREALARPSGRLSPWPQESKPALRGRPGPHFTRLLVHSSQLSACGRVAVARATT